MCVCKCCVNWRLADLVYTNISVFVSFVCRQQLEEMAKQFKFPSVYQFAVEIQKRNSTQRLAWLRQYYTTLDQPDLAHTVTNSFPQPDSAHTFSYSAATPSTSTQTAATKSHAETRTPQKDVPKATKKPKYTLKNLEPKTKHNVALTQKKSTVPQNNVPEPQKKQKIPKKNFLEVLIDIPSPASEDEVETVCSARGHKRTEKGSVSSSGASRAGGGLGVDRASSSGLGSGEAAAFLNRSDRDTPSSPDLSNGRSTTLSKPTAQGCQQEQKSSTRTRESFQGQTENSQTLSPPEGAPSSSTNRSFLTDLIGDTSILDDLFKPKPKGAQQSIPKIPPTSSSESVSTCLATPSQSSVTLNAGSVSTCLLDSSSPPSSHTRTTHQVNSPVQASKHGRKDFWDILNEGNEESINRLTDPAEVQRVCTNTNFLSRSRSREKESKSLWRTNEKFLWKK